MGADIGTSSCKTVLLDDQGGVAASATAEYPCYYPHSGYVEQNPDDWYQAFCKTTLQVISTGVDARAIGAVCIVGVTHNPVLLDSKNRVLRNAVHFWDKRSINQVKQIKSRWGEQVRDRALNVADPLWSWPQLLWIRENEPDIWDNVAHLLFPKDYVRHQLAPSPHTDLVDPTGTLLYDPRRSEWIEEFVEDLDMAPSALPETRRHDAVAGGVSRAGASESGLVAGTPVLTGTTDTAAELFGSGAIRPGQAVVKLASVGRIMLVMDKPLDHPAILNYPHIVSGLWYPGSVTKYGAGAYRWARDLFWADADEEGIYQRMDASAAGVPPGSSGILFHPHLSGEYAPQWDSKLRASFVGLSVNHSRAHLTRAVLEGVAFQIRDAMAQVLENGGICQEVRLIGGGAGSKLWSQIMADVLGQELLVPAEKSAAYGAGLLAGISIDMFPVNPDIFIKTELFTPDPTHQDIYEEQYSDFRSIGQSLAPISHDIDDLFA